MGGTCSKYGGEVGACRVLVGRPEGKRPLGKHARRWEGDFKMYFKELGVETLTGLVG
jgi:hypothetical protein